MKNGKPKEDEADFWELRLYVAGQTPKSLAAFANLKKICEEHLAGVLPDRDNRPSEKSHPCKGRSDPRHPHAREEAPRAGEKDHRGPLQHRAGARRS